MINWLIQKCDETLLPFATKMVRDNRFAFCTHHFCSASFSQEIFCSKFYTVNFAAEVFCSKFFSGSILQEILQRKFSTVNFSAEFSIRKPFWWSWARPYKNCLVGDPFADLCSWSPSSRWMNAVFSCLHLLVNSKTISDDKHREVEWWISSRSDCALLLMIKNL
jgi:hypothetical protein